MRKNGQYIKKKFQKKKYNQIKNFKKIQDKSCSTN